MYEYIDELISPKLHVCLKPCCRRRLVSYDSTISCGYMYVGLGQVFSQRDYHHMKRTINRITLVQRPSSLRDLKSSS